LHPRQQGRPQRAPIHRRSASTNLPTSPPSTSRALMAALPHAGAVAPEQQPATKPSLPNQATAWPADPGVRAPQAHLAHSTSHTGGAAREGGQGHPGPGDDASPPCLKHTDTHVPVATPETLPASAQVCVHGPGSPHSQRHGVMRIAAPLLHTTPVTQGASMPPQEPFKYLLHAHK
jgi:hypothetical protein